MGAQSAEKKVSISETSPIVISNVQPVSEPSGLLYGAVVISLLGAVGLGLVVGYMSPVLDQVKADTIENKEARSWMGSIMPLGALFGGLIAPFLIKFLGKKKALISHGLPFTLGWLCFVLDDSEHKLFYVGRLLTGISCGLVCGTAPGYVSEISTLQKRGLLGSCFQLFITLGILAAGIAGNSITYKPFAIFSAIPSLLMSVLMCFMPESPVQILSQGSLTEQTIERARNELIRLRSPNSSIDAELNQMVESQKELNEMGDEKLSEKFGKPDFYKPLTFSILLMLIQQMSGVNAILFYANNIFLSASPGINLTLANIAFCTMQSLATFGEMFIVEKLGRRILLIISGCGCSLGLGVMGIFYFLKEKDPSLEQSLAWLPLVTLVFYIISFSIGLAPVPWLMVPELTPSNNRAFISGVATAFSWGIAFLVTKFFGPIQAAIGAHSVYFIFMAHTIVGIVLMSVFLPETGGKDLSEITRHYANRWRNSMFLASGNNKNRENAFDLNKVEDQNA